MSLSRLIIGRRTLATSDPCPDIPYSIYPSTGSIDGYGLEYTSGRFLRPEDCSTITMKTTVASGSTAAIIEFDSITLTGNKTISFDFEVVSSGTLASRRSYYQLVGIDLAAVTIHNGSVTGSTSGTVSRALLSGNSFELLISMYAGSGTSTDNDYYLIVSNFDLQV